MGKLYTDGQYVHRVFHMHAPQSLLMSFAEMFTFSAALKIKGDLNTVATGYSYKVIRAGEYAE